MPLGRTRGVMLADLLVSMVLLGLLGTLSVRAVLAYSRILRGAQGRATLESAFATSAGYARAELAFLASGDLLHVAPDSLTYRAIWGSALACRVGTNEVLLLADSWLADRLPRAGRDSIFAFPAKSPSGEWVAGPVVSVGSSTCDGRAATRIVTALDTSAIGTLLPTALLPVLIFEIRQLRFYSSLGDWWLGARSVSTGEAIQPLAGPFDRPEPPFGYRDSAGVPVLDPSAVRRIAVTLRGQAPPWPGVGQRFRDSVTFDLRPANLWP